MPSDFTQAREHLLAALEADLARRPLEKPGGLDVSDELLKLPSRWYLTGFLAPMEAREEFSQQIVRQYSQSP
jgi:hypothetical protein